VQERHSNCKWKGCINRDRKATMTAKKKKGGKAELKRKCESTKLPNSNKQNHHQKQTNRNLKE
jgi:hypothetical protein